MRVSIFNLFVEESWRGGDEAGWRCFEDAVERTEMAGDPTRTGSPVVVVDEDDEGGIKELGMEGIGGGAIHVCSPSWVRGTGCRHVVHFTVGRTWESLSWGWPGGFFGIEVIMRVFWCCQCWRIVVVVVAGEGERHAVCGSRTSARGLLFRYSCPEFGSVTKFSVLPFGSVRYVHSFQKIHSRNDEQ